MTMNVDFITYFIALFLIKKLHSLLVVVQELRKSFMVYHVYKHCLQQSPRVLVSSDTSQPL